MGQEGTPWSMAAAGKSFPEKQKTEYAISCGP